MSRPVFIPDNGANYSDALGFTNYQFQSMAGVGSFLAKPFMALENLTINRIYFTTGSITNFNNYKLNVGIGTWNNTTGLASTIDPGAAGGNMTLNFSSFSSLTGVTSNSFYFVSIPDLNISAGTKYFVGIAITESSGSFIHQHRVFTMDWAKNNWQDNYQIKTRGTSFSFFQNPWTECFNWGYDSGTASTIWYNQFPGGSGGLGYSDFTSAKLIGTTLYFNTDFNSFYLDDISVSCRTNNAAFPSGVGQTYNIVLYDSDGTTALIAHTISVYPYDTGFNRRTTFPVKYTLQNNKLYHLAFRAPNATSTNDRLPVIPYLYEFQSGSALTAIFFTKTNGAASPVYNPNLKLVNELVLEVLSGNRDGGPGRSGISNIEGVTGPQ